MYEELGFVGVRSLIVSAHFAQKTVLNIKPVVMAIVKTAAKNAPSSCHLKICLSMITSGRLAPAPPIVKATTAPMLIPFAIRGIKIGIIVETRT